MKIKEILSYHQMGWIEMVKKELDSNPDISILEENGLFVAAANKKQVNFLEYLIKHAENSIYYSKNKLIMILQDVVDRLFLSPEIEAIINPYLEEYSEESSEDSRAHDFDDLDSDGEYDEIPEEEYENQSNTNSQDYHDMSISDNSASNSANDITLSGDQITDESISI